jgi:hypothetical protein
MQASPKVRRVSMRVAAVALAVSLAIAPAPSEAIAPVLLILVKQAAQQMAQSLIKDAILGSLRGMGCKGMALANALEAMDLRGGAGMGLPPGMAGLPGGMAVPGLAADTTARMGSLMPALGRMPAGMATDPEQAAMMARVMESMSRPLSPGETVATIDELAELGFLPKPIQGELKECMTFLPAAIPALGMGLGMMKPIVPQLRKARDELHALSPAEQDEIAASLVEQMRSMSADERSSMLEHLDGGFFPRRVAQGVRTAFAGR